jgi:hypothetical protein
MTLKLQRSPVEPVRIERRLQLGPSGSIADALRQTIKEMALELSRHASRHMYGTYAMEAAASGEASIEGAGGQVEITITVVRRR